MEGSAGGIWPGGRRLTITVLFLARVRYLFSFTSYWSSLIPVDFVLMSHKTSRHVGCIDSSCTFVSNNPFINGCSGDIYDMTSRSHGRMTWSVSDLRNDGIYFLVVGVYMYLVWPRRPYRQYQPPPLHLAGGWCKTSHAS